MLRLPGSLPEMTALKLDVQLSATTADGCGLTSRRCQAAERKCGAQFDTDSAAAGGWAEVPLTLSWQGSAVSVGFVPGPAGLLKVWCTAAGSLLLNATSGGAQVCKWVSHSSRDTLPLQQLPAFASLERAMALQTAVLLQCKA